MFTSKHRKIGGINLMEVNKHLKISDSMVSKYYRHCASQIQSQTHSIQETIEYLKSKYYAVEVSQDNDTYKQWKESIILKQINKLTNDFEFEGYMIPYEGPNIESFNLAYQKNCQKKMLRFPVTDQARDWHQNVIHNPAYIFFEKKLGEIVSCGVGVTLIFQELVIYRGISEKDIEIQSDYFKSFIQVLSGSTLIPTYDEFCTNLKFE